MKLLIAFIIGSILFHIGNNKGNKLEKNIQIPNMVKVSDKLYFDQVEVTNIDWVLYIQKFKDLYGEDSEEYRSLLPSFRSLGQVYSEEKEDFFVNDKYHEHPVVGVSYEQAQNYCLWRAKELKRNKELAFGLSIRLPKKDEWEKVASKSYSERTRKMIENRFDNTKDLYHFLNQSSFQKNNTVPVFSYFPNNYDIYNLYGNVSEMTLEKGVSKGGSYIDKEQEISVLTDIGYEKEMPWLGFRCVCEIQ